MKNRQSICFLFIVSCFFTLGCASFATNPYDYTIAGDTLSPTTVIRASSEARNANIATDVEAHERRMRVVMANRCYEDYGPICMALGGYGGGMYLPYDYTTMGLLAAANQKNDEPAGDNSSAVAKEALDRANRAIKEVDDLEAKLAGEE